MYRSPAHLVSRFTWAAYRRWSRVCFSWSTADKEPWVFALVIGVIAATFGIVLSAAFTHKDERRRAFVAHENDQRNLTCLARNVYFEARGEPRSGQHAVAEVTMNRLASGRFPETVCDVVHQKSWDAGRRRYVGAFSWTELGTLPTPTDEEWQRAWKAAEAVYYGKEEPVVEGALFYHASYIMPDWATNKKSLTRIGRHVFYK
jgi:spore germination cell wall hydrolase CwlJ-like protein